MKCENCGASISQNAKFCMCCGSPVDKDNEFTYNYNATSKSEKVERYIDEADLARVSIESNKHKFRVCFVIAWVVLLIVLFVLIRTASNSGRGLSLLAFGYWVIAIILTVRMATVIMMVGNLTTLSAA